MEKIILIAYLPFYLSCSSLIAVETESQDQERESNEFWPPDMVPHPHPPQPKKDDNLA